MTDVEIIGLLKTYVNKTLVGGGALKGKNCTIDSIAPITGGNRVTFKWTLDDGTVETGHLDVMNGLNGQDGQDGQDGKGIQSVSVNENNHLIITYSDGTTTDAGQIEIHSAVDSVNGQTGAVVLDAEAVGALPANTPIPSKTSNLTNDSGFITKAVNDLVSYYLKSETYSKTQVDDIVTAVKNSRFEVVATLPTTDIKTNVIYLVPKSPSQTSNVKNEYINLDGTTSGWEKIGDTEIDLSDYVTTQALNTALANYTTTADLTTLLAAKQDVLTFDNAPTENSNNPVKSGGVYNSEQDIYKINGFLGAKNLVQYPYFYGISGHTETLNDVDFTINDDLSITIDGTSTNSGEIYYAIKKNIYINDLKSKNLILSSGGVSGTDVWLGVYEYDQEGTSTVTHTYTTKDADTVAFTLDDTTIKINVFIRVKALATIDNVTIYPMLRYAEDIDSTYQPYAKTNRQLTEDSVDWDDMSNIGSANTLDNIAETTVNSASGLTATVNNDKTITVAPTSGTYPYTLPQRLIVDLTKAKPDFAFFPCKLSGCPSGGSLNAGSGYQIYYANYVDTNGIKVDAGDGVTITEEFNRTTYPNARIMMRINAGVTLNGPLVFKPMLTPVDYNGPYVPYAKTNRELTENVTPTNLTCTLNSTYVDDGAVYATKIGNLVVMSGYFHVSQTAPRSSALITLPSGVTPFIGNAYGIGIRDDDTITRLRLNNNTIIADATSGASVSWYNILMSFLVK